MKVREVDNFRDLQDIWNDLVSRNLLGNNIFLTWDWLSTWWRHFGKGRRLIILTVEEQDKVLAIAPLMLSKYKLLGFGSIKKIEFLGARQSDYNNFIVAEKNVDCLKHIVNYLVEDVSDWNWIELKEIPENHNYPVQFFRKLPSRLTVKERVYNICPYMTLPNSFDNLMKGLSSNMRRYLRKNLKKLQEIHKRVELTRFDEAGFSVEEAMNTFINIHQAEWLSKGLPGAFRDEAFRNFHLDVAKRLADKGWLGLYFLMLDDEPISVNYSFEYAKTMYYYLGGFLPQYSNYSVGSLTIMHSLRKCIENGFKEYDMMRGSDHYKTRWTDKYRRNFEIRLVKDKIDSKFYNWVTWDSTIDSISSKLNFSLKKIHYEA